MEPRHKLPSVFLAAACVSLSACDNGSSSSREAPLVAAQETAISERSVMIGFDGPRFDACAGFGRVANLNPRGDNFLAVRAAPSREAEEIDRLGPDRGVSMCQQVGDWIGIVYASESDEAGSCGTGSPVPDVRAYDGPCKQGWVDENYLKLVAG